MKQKLKLSDRLDRLWITFNKKPKGKMESYFSVTIPWLVSGVTWALVGIATIAINSGWKSAQANKWVIPALFAIAALQTTALVCIDYKYKYTDAIHTHYLQRRQNKLDKITRANKEN